MIWVVGLGPGDPGLLTLRGAEILKRAEVVYVPVSSSSEASLAEQVVLRTAPGVEVRRVVFKMGSTTRDDLRKIAAELDNAGEAVYAVLGDPALYSTFAKIKPYLNSPWSYVPGVTSVTSCAARIGRDVASGDESIAIVPATRAGLLRTAAELFDTVVVVKANRNIEGVNALLSRFGGVAARRCFLSGEQFSNFVEWDDYFTTVYIWRGR